MNCIFGIKLSNRSLCKCVFIKFPNIFSDKRVAVDGHKVNLSGISGKNGIGKKAFLFLITYMSSFFYHHFH